MLRMIQEDIDGGTKNTYTQCPIALTIQRELNKKCFVYLDTVVVFQKNNFLSKTASRYNLSKRVSQFIKKFDKDEKVEPINFKLLRKV